MTELAQVFIPEQPHHMPMQLNTFYEVKYLHYIMVLFVSGEPTANTPNEQAGKSNS